MIGTSPDHLCRLIARSHFLTMSGLEEALGILIGADALLFVSIVPWPLQPSDWRQYSNVHVQIVRVYCRTSAEVYGSTAFQIFLLFSHLVVLWTQGPY